MTRKNPHAGLLKIRISQRDQSVAVVQATQSQIQRLVERIEQLSGSITTWSEARKKLQAGVVKLQLWRENEAYRTELIEQKNELVQEFASLQDRLHQERSILLEHEKELKQIEKIIEHHEAARRSKDLAAEQAQLDEWAGLQARISRTTLP
jgi:hypothetical protein